MTNDEHGERQRPAPSRTAPLPATAEGRRLRAMNLLFELRAFIALFVLILGVLVIGVPVVGGDTTRGPLTICITVFGEVAETDGEIS